MVTGIYDLWNSGNPLGILTWHRLCLSKTSFILNGCRSRTPSYILGTYILFNYNWFLTYNTTLFLSQPQPKLLLSWYKLPWRLFPAAFVLVVGGVGVVNINWFFGMHSPLLLLADVVFWLAFELGLSRVELFSLPLQCLERCPIWTR